MRKLLATLVATAALAGGSIALTGSASAAVPLAPTDCVSYTIKLVNGQWRLVQTTSTSCTSSSSGTSGSSSGSTSGTGTSGTATNNCPLGGCTSTATGTGGRSR